MRVEFLRVGADKKRSETMIQMLEGKLRHFHLLITHGAISMSFREQHLTALEEWFIRAGFLDI